MGSNSPTDINANCTLDWKLAVFSKGEIGNIVTWALLCDLNQNLTTSTNFHWAVTIILIVNPVLYKDKKTVSYTGNRSFKSSIDDFPHWHWISGWLCGIVGLFFFETFPSKWVSFERRTSSCESENVPTSSSCSIIHWLRSSSRILSVHDIITTVCLSAAVRLNERLLQTL